MADPYLLNSAGYSAEDDPALMLPPLAKQQALAASVRPRPSQGPTRLTSIPTQGPQTPEPGQSYEPQAAPAAPAPAARPDYRQQALDMMKQANEAATTMPDMSQQVQRYRQGYEAAGPDMAMGMLMHQLGGSGGREMGGQVFKQALANRQKQTTPYGTLDYEGGFTSDPNKEREFKVQRLEKQAQLMEQMATHAETIEERTFARQEATRLREMQIQMHRDQMRMQGANLAETRQLRRDQLEAGKWVKLKNEAGDEYLLNTTTGATKGGGAPGGAAGALGAPERLPKLNDSQGKAVAFGMRAAEAAQQLENLGTDYSSASVAAKGGLERLPYVGGLAGSAYNVAMGANEQKAEQAQRNFINAILRRESGAVINPDEFSNARQQYFPQPGDSDEVLAQKKTNRETSIRGLQIESGPGARFVTEKLKPATKPITRPGALPQTQLKARVNSYYD